MTDTFRELIQDASKTLTLLSKVRCVSNYRLPPGSNPKNLFSWPNTRYLGAEGKSFLEERGVCMRDNRVTSFSVPYEIYDKMEKIDEPDVTNVRLTRVLLDVFQIVSGGKPVTGIEAAWDKSENPGRIAPTSMSDIQGLNEFAKHGDGYLIFYREDEEYEIKLRAFAHSVVLQARPELGDFAISHTDLGNFVGEKVDHRRRKNRHVVFNTNRKYLCDVLRQTSDAVEKLVADNDLVDGIKHSFHTHSANCFGNPPEI